jgi:hypothetical protein
MNKELIIEMAKQAKAIPIHKDFNQLALIGIENIEHFAKLIAEHERNEIIEILDASTGYVHMDAIRERT